MRHTTAHSTKYPGIENMSLRPRQRSSDAQSQCLSGSVACSPTLPALPDTTYRSCVSLNTGKMAMLGLHLAAKSPAQVYANSDPAPWLEPSCSNQDAASALTEHFQTAPLHVTVTAYTVSERKLMRDAERFLPNDLFLPPWLYYRAAP